PMRARRNGPRSAPCAEHATEGCTMLLRSHHADICRRFGLQPFVVRELARLDLLRLPAVRPHRTDEQTQQKSGGFAAGQDCNDTGNGLSLVSAKTRNPRSGWQPALRVRVFPLVGREAVSVKSPNDLRSLTPMRGEGQTPCVQS